MSSSKVFGAALFCVGLSPLATAAVITPNVHIVSSSGGAIANNVGCETGGWTHTVDVYDGEFSIVFTPNHFYMNEARTRSPHTSLSWCTIKLDIWMPKDTCYTMDAAMVVGTASLSPYSNVDFTPIVETWGTSWNGVDWIRQDTFRADRGLMQVKAGHQGDYLNIAAVVNENQKTVSSCAEGNHLTLGLQAQMYEVTPQANTYPNEMKVRSFEYVFKTRKKLSLPVLKPRLPSL